MSTKEPLVVEFGDDHCRNVYFPPLDRRLRGRFDAVKLAQHDRDAGELVNTWPEPVAGQQLAIDADAGEVAIVEPLHAFPAIVARLKGRGLRLAPAREAVSCDVPTALHYAKAAVTAGQARVVSGTLPDAIDATKVRSNFLVPPTVNTQATLATALTKLADAQAAQTEVLSKLLAKLK
jgi:hypothetical protein